MEEDPKVRVRVEGPSPSDRFWGDVRTGRGLRLESLVHWAEDRVGKDSGVLAIGIEEWCTATTTRRTTKGCRQVPEPWMCVFVGGVMSAEERGSGPEVSCVGGALGHHRTFGQG